MPFPNLVVRAQLDAAGVTRGVQQTIREFSSLRERVQRSIGTGSLLPDTEQMGRRAAEDLISGLRDTFQQRQGAIRSQLFAGLINRAEANRQGRAAAVELTRGLQAVSAELERRGLLTPAVQAQLVRQMRNAAIPAGREGAEAIAEGIEQARGAISDAIDASLTAGIRQAREKAVREAGVMMRDVGKRMQSVGRSLSLFVTAPLVAAGGLAVRSAAQIEQLERGLLAITGSAEETARQLAELEEVAELPGIGFREAVEGATALQVLNFSAETATRTLRAFGNAIALTGGGPAELDRIIVQLTQMASTGRILTQDLRPIIQTAPAVGRALQEAFGTVSAQEIEALGLTFDEFLERLLTGLETLPPAAVGLSETFSQVRDDITLALAAIGDTMAPIIRTFAQGVKDAAEAVRDLSPETRRWAVALAATAAAIGPLTVGLGALTAVLGSAAAALGTTLLPLIAVGGPIVLGLAALSAAFIKNRLDAAAAAEAVDEFARSLNGLNQEQLIDLSAGILGQIEELERAKAELPQTVTIASGLGASTIENPELARIDRQIEGLEARLQRIPEEFQRVRDAANSVSADPIVALGNASEETANAIARLAGFLREATLTEAFGVVDVSDLPNNLRAAFREAESLRSRLAAVEETIADVAEAGGTIPEAATEFVRRLRAEIAETDAEVARLVQTLGLQGPQVATLGVTIGGIVIENPEEVQRRYQQAVRERLEEEAVRAQLHLEFVTPFGQREESATSNARDEAVQRAQEATRAFTENVTAGREVISAFGDLASVSGELSEGLSEFLRSLETVGAGISRIRFGQELEAAGEGLLGGLAQVSGTISVFSGLIGVGRGLADAFRSREREEQRAIDALEQFRLKLEGFDVTPAILSGASRAAREAADRFPFDEIFQQSLRFPPELTLTRENLNAVLRDTGLTFAQLEAAARDLGVTLVRENGTIDREALEELATRAREAADAMTRFRDTLEDQRSLLEAERTIRGVEITPEVRIQGELDLLEEFAPELVRAFGLDQIDLTVPEGVAQAREIIIQILEAIKDGAIPPELLDQLPEGVRTLLEILVNIGDGLNDLGRAVDSATSQIRNIPEVFNFTLASIRAAGVREFTGVDAPIAPQSPSFTAPITTRPPTNDPQVGGVSITVEDGAVRITSDDGLAERVVTGVESAIRAALSEAGVRVTPDMIEEIRRKLKPSLVAAASSQGAEARRQANLWPGQ